jgi:hypothetical protein
LHLQAVQPLFVLRFPSDNRQIDFAIDRVQLLAYNRCVTKRFAFDN